MEESRLTSLFSNLLEFLEFKKGSKLPVELLSAVN